MNDYYYYSIPFTWANAPVVRLSVCLSLNSTLFANLLWTHFSWTKYVRTEEGRTYLQESRRRSTSLCVVLGVAFREFRSCIYSIYLRGIVWRKTATHKNNVIRFFQMRWKAAIIYSEIITRALQIRHSFVWNVWKRDGFWGPWCNLQLTSLSWPVQ